MTNKCDLVARMGELKVENANLKARIEQLRAFAQFVIEQLDVAALDDCEGGVASVNAKLAGQYLNDYRHTREAIHNIKDRAAELLDGADDDT